MEYSILIFSLAGFCAFSGRYTWSCLYTWSHLLGAPLSHAALKVIVKKDSWSVQYYPLSSAGVSSPAQNQRVSGRRETVRYSLAKVVVTEDRGKLPVAIR